MSEHEPEPRVTPEGFITLSSQPPRYRSRIWWPLLMIEVAIGRGRRRAAQRRHPEDFALPAVVLATDETQMMISSPEALEAVRGILAAGRRGMPALSPGDSLAIDGGRITHVILRQELDDMWGGAHPPRKDPE